MTGWDAVARDVRAAGRALAAAGPEARSAALQRMAAALRAEAPRILAENALDVATARAAGLAAPLVARLGLTSSKLDGLAEGLLRLAASPDPVGRVLRRTELAEGLVLDQHTVPLGAVLVIFESRPDALPQIAGLAVRAGAGLLLKGGAEAARSNAVLAEVLCGALAPLPAAAVTLAATRADVAELLRLDDTIDLVIPRGSNALVRAIRDGTRIPVLGHADGVCHVYLHAAADLAKAGSVVLDAKTDYPAACNAMETLLVDRALVGRGAERVLEALRAAGVALHAGPDCPWAAAWALPAAPALHHEYADLACTVQVVDGVQAAIAHVEAHGSAHTDTIVTEDAAAAQQFLDGVDSACVFVNASTRFADGARFGLGAEIGVSTSRIGARGPVGVDGLLTTRWRLVGRGDTVAPFTRGERRFSWRPLDP